MKMLHEKKSGFVNEPKCSGLVDGKARVTNGWKKTAVSVFQHLLLWMIEIS
jgi:hypothetical protein